VLQCIAVCCSVLQCVAVCCSVLQCVAVCDSLFQPQLQNSGLFSNILSVFLCVGERERDCVYMCACTCVFACVFYVYLRERERE